jgi:histidinol dehydrogenase
MDSAGAVIDMPAGPSEVLVIADASASAEFVAADLLSQAEHGIDSQVLLLTTSADLAGAVEQAVATQLAGLSRADIARQSLANSRVIIVDDLDEAIEISNRYAPEHLILQFDAARDRLRDIRNAGSVFLGHWTPESVGDYCSGTNHVLPTYGFARAYSGLGTEQFLRQMSVQELSSDGLVRIGNTTAELANLEGLDGHAAAVQIRLEAVS